MKGEELACLLEKPMDYSYDGGHVSTGYSYSKVLEKVISRRCSHHAAAGKK